MIAHPETTIFVAGRKGDNSITECKFVQCAFDAPRSGVPSQDSQGLLELSHRAPDPLPARSDTPHEVEATLMDHDSVVCPKVELTRV